MSPDVSYTERCPWCENLVTRAKFLEIQERIRQEERKRLAEAEAKLRQRLDQEFHQKVEAEKNSLEKRLKDEAEKKLTALIAERDQTKVKLKELEAREAVMLQEVKEQAEQRAKSILEEAERRRTKELNEQRQILDKHKDQALLKQVAEFNRERERYQKKMKEMERQLQQKTANQIGDGAEIDLYEALRDAFPSDTIKRIPKGQPGADIMHEVLHKGEVCGRIVYDSKNRQAWQTAFATKLRQDQIDAHADHAILSTTTFPAGEKELCIESDVVVASPARIVSVVKLLRQAMVRMHVMGLTMKERGGKMTALYKYIASDLYKQKMSQAANLTQQVLDLDVEEQKDHQKVWKRRGLIATQLKNVLGEIDTDVSAILEAKEGQRPAA
jgi:hypothetical protein